MSSNILKYTGCSAIIYREKDNKVFIAQRKLTKSFGAGLWETIGGGIEEEDLTPIDCIKREIREELNVEIKNIKEFKDYTIKIEDKDKYFIKTFLVELDSEPKPNIDDFESYGWFDKDEIQYMDFTSNCKERLNDYFSKL